jgi:hypothetical protein
MPRNPKVIEQGDGSQFGEVTCRNCDYRWFPDATRWRNVSLSNGDKVLYCPACAVKNRVSKEKLKQIIAHTDTMGEMRKIGR